MLTAIFFTFAWGGLFFYFCLTVYRGTPEVSESELVSVWKNVILLEVFKNNPPSVWKSVILPTVIYVLLHPVIGKVWCLLVEGLCYVVDYTYDLRGTTSSWGGWSREGRMRFASMWPITGPIGLAITFLGSLFGLLFRGLFR